jgi:hypothetical protein
MLEGKDRAKHGKSGGRQPVLAKDGAIPSCTSTEKMSLVLFSATEQMFYHSTADEIRSKHGIYYVY